METGKWLAPRFALLTCTQKLPDRFVFTGTLPADPGPHEPVIVISLEVTRPWSGSSHLIPTITDVLNEKYSSLRRSSHPLGSFETALKEINEALMNLAEAGETDWLGHVNGMLALVVGNELHLAQTGNATAFLFRSRKISQVIEPSDSRDLHPLTTFSNIVSGYTNAGDRIVLGNQDLFTLVSLDNVRAAVTDTSPWEAAQGIARAIKKSRIMSITGAVIGVEQARFWDEAGAEPGILNLEEITSGWHQKAWKQLKPLLHKGKQGGLKAWGKTVSLVQSGRQRWQEDLGPRTKAALARSGKAAGELAKKAPTKIPKVILPAAPTDGGMAAPSWLATADSFVGGRLWQPLAQRTLGAREMVTSLDTGLRRLALWGRPFVSGKNFRWVVVGVAILLLWISIHSAQVRHAQQLAQAAFDKNEGHVNAAAALADRVTADVTLKQTKQAQNEALQALQELDALDNPTTAQAASANDLRQTLQTQEDKLTKTTRLSAKATHPISLNGHNLAVSDTGFYVLDGGTSGIYIPRQTAGQTLNFTVGQDQTKVTSTEVDTDTGTIYAWLSSKQLVSGKADNAAVGFVARTTSDTTYADGNVIRLFNQNLYLLDSTGGKLWKYNFADPNFGHGISQLDPADTTAKGALDMAIDGYVYLLRPDNTVVKMLRGKADGTFSLKDAPSQGLSYKRLFTSADADHLLILATGPKAADTRILLFDKSGEFQQQYAFKQPPAEIRDISADTKAKRLFILTAQSVDEFLY